MNFPTSSLAPSANEFVPGRGYGASPRDNTTLQADSELSSAASEWVPGAAGAYTAGQAGLNNMQDMAYALQQTETVTEQMVEVNWNGTTIFVAESSTYVAEDGSLAYAEGDGSGMLSPAGETHTAADGIAMAAPAAEEVDGLQWAQTSTTLPAPPKRTLQTIGIPEPVRNHFRSLDIDSLKQMNPDNERYKELPMRYHSAYPLFNPHSSPSASVAQGSGGSCFGYPCALYKVTDQADSQLYALRRFDNVRTAPTVVANTAGRWHDVRHPGIVSLYGAVLEKGALFFSYMYHAGAQSLKERFIDQRGPLLSESLIWRLVVQLLSALRHVHGRGYSVRVVEPAHIILTSGTIARFSSVGILDILEFESRKSVPELQQDDLIKLGRVVLSLMTRAVINTKNTEDAVALMKQHYSIDLQRVVIALLSGKLNANQLCSNPTIADRIHEELDTANAATDALHSHLRNEYENGRLLRLIMKLGFVNERPADHSHMTPNWSETGDQYVLKLFRDHVFHQVDGDGLPILDAGHVLTALNKLDAGDPEEILLSSRDGKDLMVVSYADMQRCLESSFLELSQQSQVALSNAAAQVSGGAAHGTSGGGGHSGGHGGGHGMSGHQGHQQGHHGHHSSGLPSGGYQGRGGRHSGGRGSSGARSNSSSNLAAMGSTSSGGSSQQGGMGASRGYNSVGMNLNMAGGAAGTSASYGGSGGNPYSQQGSPYSASTQQAGYYNQSSSGGDYGAASTTASGYGGNTAAGYGSSAPPRYTSNSGYNSNYGGNY